MAGKNGRRSWGWVAKQRSGRYLASYIGPDLLRHYAGATYTSKLDAEAWLATERRLIELETWTPPAERAAAKRATTVTLDVYATTWIEQRPLKPRTRSMYDDLLRLHIKPQLGNVPIGALSGAAVRAWHSKLGTEHKRRNAHAYGLLHAVCATAVKDGLLATNPAMIERATSTPRTRQPVILSIAELDQVADKMPPNLKALVLLAAWCGLRWGEVTELRRKDIERDCEVVFVSRAVTHRGGCQIDTTKTSKPRAVVIPRLFRPDIKHHLDTYVMKEADALLFTAPRSCHYDEHTFRDQFKAALKAVGREGVRIHDLRHFAGTQTARVANLPESMARMGHTSVKASLMYQQRVSGRDAEIADDLSALAEAELGRTTG
jgi:integrase